MAREARHLAGGLVRAGVGARSWVWAKATRHIGTRGAGLEWRQTGVDGSEVEYAEHWIL